MSKVLAGPASGALLEGQGTLNKSAGALILGTCGCQWTLSY